MSTRSSGGSSRSAVAALMAACLTAGLMQTVVIPIQSEFPQIFDAPRELTAWIVTGAAAGAAAFSPISGRAGDLYGRKRAAVAVLLVFTAGSIVAALTMNVGVMIAARVAQGIAIGVIPLSISILRDLVSARRLPGAIALASGMLGGGAAFGMPIGAVAAQWFDWHVIFWLCAVLGVTISIWLAKTVPKSTDLDVGRFDIVGAIGTVLGSAALLIGIAQGLDWGWLSPPVVSLLGGGALTLVLVNIWMLRTRDPLIDVRVTMRRPVLFTNSAALVINFANMGVNVVFPQLMTQPRVAGLGLEPIAASFVMMLSAAAQMLATPLVARVSRAIGPRAILIVGASTGSIAITVPAFLPPSLAVIIVANVVIGVGFAFVFSALPQLIMSSVPYTQVAAANGLNAQIRTFGTAAGAALSAAILAAMSVADRPTALAFSTGLVVCGAAGFLGALIGVLIPRVRRTEPIRRVNGGRSSIALDTSGVSVSPGRTDDLHRGSMDRRGS